MTETHAPYTVGEMAETAENKALIFDGDRDQLLPYFSKLAGLMGLSEWSFTLADDPDPENNANICSIPASRMATLQVSADWPNWTPEMLRRTFVHELVHCHVEPLELPLNALSPYVGSVVYSVSYTHYREAEETTVDGIARAWARLLPLPIRDEAPAEEAA